MHEPLTTLREQFEARTSTRDSLDALDADTAGFDGSTDRHIA